MITTVGMEGIKYPERIERLLDVMVAIPKDGWGLVFLEVEKKIGAAALERIILQAYQIEKAMGDGQGRDEREALNAPRIIASIPPAKQSRGDQFTV